MSLRPARAMIVTLALGALGLGLVACAGPGGPPDPISTTTAPTTPEPTQSEEPVAEIGKPITVTCDDLLATADLTFYGMDFTPVPDFEPMPSSRAGLLVGYHGLACAWEDGASGQRITVAVADLPEENLTELKNELVLSSNSVPTYEVEGYFQMIGSVGEGEAFSDPFWIYATSEVFYEPGDASPVIEAAIAALTG